MYYLDLHVFVFTFSDAENSSDCGSSEDDFPTFILTDEQVKHGGVVLCIIIGIYSFTLLARVCNDFFLPCVETICELLNLTPVSEYYIFVWH